MKTWLLLDANYLSHRAFHSLGDLSHAGVSTGVVYGVLREVIALQDTFATTRIAFCFDSGRNLRKLDHPGYKASRGPEGKTEEELEAYRAVREQINALRCDYLPSIGFRNILHQKGYEADDVIASVCHNLPKNNEAIIVSADKDLYQLLSPQVTIYNLHLKKHAITVESFATQYGVSPTQWVDVKALAGCDGDDVEGIKGVGEKTAGKFLNGTLKPTTKAFQDILKNKKLWDRNRHLVKLPYPGCDQFGLREDNIKPSDWKATLKRLGIRSLD